MGVLATRRAVLAGVGCVLAAGSARAADDPIAAIERAGGGRLGVFAHDLASGRTLVHRADERFLLCSTFKAVLTALVLARVDRACESLDATVPFGAADLLPASPVTTAHVAQGMLTVAALCEAAMTVSDNAAANLLLARVGGPAGVTAFVRALGDRETRLDRYETALGQRDGERDTTTPRAYATTLGAILTGRVLSPAGRARWEGWMAGNAVGGRRLRAALPAGWRVGDRTGTGDGFCNDVAIARPPGGGVLVIAAYHDAPGLTMVAQERVLRAVGAAAARWYAGLPH